TAPMPLRSIGICPAASSMPTAEEQIFMRREPQKKSRQMPSKRAFTGSLSKPIYLADAKPNAIAGQLGITVDQNDLRAHAQHALDIRWSDLDEFLDVDPRKANVWEQRGKAWTEHVSNIPRGDPNWWCTFVWQQVTTHVPGFS